MVDGGSLMLTWISNNGSTWPLDGSLGVDVRDGASGIFALPTDLTIDQRVGFDGGVMVSARRAPRRVALEFLLVDDVAGQVGTLWRNFATALARGGRFRYVGPNGTLTLNDVVLEGPANNGTGLNIGVRPDDWFPVSFLALDPWWLDSPGWQHVLPIGTPTGFDAAVAFDSAVTPFDGGTQTLVQILGDAASAPVVEVTGPMTTLTVGTSTGTWELANPLSAGQVMIVRHTPGGTFYPASAGSIGPHMLGSPIDWSLLTARSQLFTLPLGLTSIFVGATGTNGSSLVRFLYHQRFLTP